MKNSLRQGLGLHIQKSYVEGIYSDNSQNRKLGRVGMSYGHLLVIGINILFMMGNGKYY